MVKQEDYLQVALKTSQERVLTDFWNANAKRRVWVSHNDVETPFDKIADNYLILIIKMLLRFETPACNEMIKALLKEAIARDLLGVEE